MDGKISPRQESLSGHDANRVLTFGFASVIVLLAAAIGIGLYAMCRLSSHLEHVVLDHSAHNELITEMRNCARERSMLLHEMVITPDPFVREELVRAIEREGDSYRRAWRLLVSQELTTEEWALLSEQDAATAITMPLQYEVIDLMRSGDFEAAKEVLLTQEVPAQGKVVEVADRFHLMQQEQNRKLLSEGAAHFRQGRMQMFILGGTAALLSALVGSFVRRKIRSIMNSLSETQGELESVNQELEHRVCLRTQELERVNAFLQAEIREREEAENKLQESAHQLQAKTHHLERANQELQRFAYVTSHDLKAPLRAISYLTTSIEEDLSNGQRELVFDQLQLCRRRIQRMDRLVDALLEYGAVANTPSEVRIVSTLETLQGLMSQFAPLPFRLEFGSPMPRFATHADHLMKVFGELIANAICHHNQAFGRIVCGAAPLGDVIEFWVKDDGPGIAPEHHGRIFELFQTLTLRDKTEYLGVGLARAKKIVHCYGGDIQVESEPGKGSTFRFTWPSRAAGVKREPSWESGLEAVGQRGRDYAFERW